MDPKISAAISTAKNLPGARSWRSCLQLLIALAVFCGGSVARAQQADTWVGGAAGSTNNWTITNNWNVGGNLAKGMTTNGDALTFGVSTTMNPNNNFPTIITNTTVHTTNLFGIYSITFNTNGYALTGNALMITNGITDGYGANSEAIPLTLGKSQTFQNTSTYLGPQGTNAVYATNIESGTIDLKTNTLTIAGTAPFFLNGSITSTNSGSLIVNNGSITRLAVSNSFGINAVQITNVFNISSYTTNNTYYTNSYVVVGVSTNYTYFTNTVIVTNGTFVYTTNLLGPRNPDVVSVAQGSTLQLNNAYGIPSAANVASVGNVKLDGTLDLNGISPTINGLEDSGSGNGVVDNINTANTGTYTLTLGLGNSNAVFSGAIGAIGTGATSGTIGLTKTGWGKETLTGINYYNGPTLINQGTLAVGIGAYLGANSTTLTINSGAVLDVTGLGSQGYLPPGPLTVAAGTPTKPYTNFLGSYDPYWGADPTNYVVSISGTNNVLTYQTNVVAGISTNIVITTNFVSLSYSSNSIISIITADVYGNFTVNGGGAISPLTPLSPFIATWAIQGNLTMDTDQQGALNRVNFLLNNTTTPGGGTNDLITVSGTLKIGDELDFLITPVTGTLAAGTYTLMTSSHYVPETGVDAPNLKVIESRGLFGDTVQASGNNITLTSLGGTAAPGTIVWAGTPTLNNWDVHLSQNWLFNGTNDYFYPGDNVVFNDVGVGTVVLPVVLEAGSMTFNNSMTNITFAASTSTFVTGPGGLVKNGSGTVTLQNPNSFTGDVTVNAGTLAIGYFNVSQNQLLLYNGVPAGSLILGGGTINQNAQAESTPITPFQNLTINPGASAIRQTARLSNELPYYTISNNVTRLVGGVLDLNTTGRAGSHAGVFFNGTNSPDGTNDYGKNGILGGWATMYLNDWVYANTANTEANAGSSALPAARYQNDSNPANWGATSNVLVSASVSGVNTKTINSLKINTTGSYAVSINPGQTLTIASGGILVPTSFLVCLGAINGGTLLGAVTNDLVLLNNNILTPSTLAISSVIADNGGPCGLTSAGGGTTVLTGNNTYTGPTYIDNGFAGSAPGTLQIGANGTSGSIATSSAIIDNGTLAFYRADNTTVGPTAGSIVTGPITGSGGLTKLGASALTLTANTPLSGLVTISAGTLQLGNGGAVGSVSNAVGIVDNATLTFDNNNTVGYPNVISGYGSLVQFGTGNLIIATNETYSGNTVVSNGTLTLTAAGYLTNTAAIVVRAGALLDVSAVNGGAGLTLRSANPPEILAGSGTINGSIATAAGTKLSPGTNGVIGTLTLNNDLTLNGGVFVFDVGNGNGNGDRVNVGGTLAMNSGTVIINVLGGSLNPAVYPLFHYTGGITGIPANLGLFIPAGGLNATLIVDTINNNLDLNVSAFGNTTALTWVGDGSANVWNIGGAANWNDGSGPATYLNPNYTTFDDSGSNSPAINITAQVSPASVTNNSITKNYTLGIPAGAGRITGGASLIQNGTSQLTLQALNDYLGGTFINAGTVQMGNNTAANADGMVGGNGAVIIGPSGTLVVSNFATETLSGSLSGSGHLVQQGVGKLVLAGDNSAYTGVIWATNFLQMGNGVSGNLGIGPVTNNRTLLLNVGPTPVSTVVVSANISGSGNVTNIGPGIAVLTGTNTYAGSTVIPQGTIRLGSDYALPTTTALIMDDNNSPGAVGTLDLNGHNATIGSLQGTNTGQGNATLVECQIVNNGAGAGTNTLTIGGGATTTFNGQLLDNTLTPLGTGKLALLVTNDTILILNACFNNVTVNTFPNLFSGGITVSNAAVVLGVNTGTPPANTGGAANGTGLNGPGKITLLGGHGTITNGMTGLPTNGVLYAAGNTEYGGTSTTPTINTQIGEVNVPAGEFGSIFGPARGQFACTLTGSGTLTYQPTYVRSRLGGDWSGFTGTIIFQGMPVPNSGGGGFGIDQANGFANATLYMGLNNVNQCQISGTIGGHVFPIGALSGGDSTSVIGGGTTANGTSNGAANTIWAIGSLGLTTTNGSQITDAGCGIRVVGGSLTLTNNTLSYGGQTVISNSTLALVPLLPIASIITNGDLTTTTNFTPINYPANSTYLVGSNITIVAGILDLSQVGSNTLVLGHSGAQTLFGNGTIIGNLVVTNGSTVAPGRRASDTGNYPGKLKVTGTATILTNSTLRMAFNRTNAVTAGPTNDTITATGGLSISNGVAFIAVNAGDTAFAPQSTNVFPFFSSAVTTITNISVPTNFPVGVFWLTNLDGTRSDIPAGSMAIANINTNTINTNASPLQVTVNGNQLTLGWAANLGWILQSQTNNASVGLSTNWVDVAGSALITNVVITVNPNSPSVFYRLRSPP